MASRLSRENPTIEAELGILLQRPGSPNTPAVFDAPNRPPQRVSLSGAWAIMPAAGVDVPVEAARLVPLAV